MAWFVDWVYSVTGLTTTSSTVNPTGSTAGTTTPGSVTTGQPVGPCFTTGSCDISGSEHTGTVYNVASAADCQSECVASTGCTYFTWYEHSHKCRLFSVCNPSGENCADCVKVENLTSVVPLTVVPGPG